MKKLIDYFKNLTGTEKAVALAIVLAAAVVCFGVLKMTAGAIGSSVNEARINALETEKQQALKRAEEAEKRDLILQGKIQAKDEQIQSLTSQIAESNQRVENAHNETQSARATVNKVRADKPHFNSADDAGRIVELGSGLRELYPDTP